MAAEMFYLKYIFAGFATTEEASIATNYLLTMQFVLHGKCNTLQRHVMFAPTNMPSDSQYQTECSNRTSDTILIVHELFNLIDVSILPEWIFRLVS